MKSRFLFLIGLVLAIVAAFFVYSRLNPAKAEIEIYASPIQAGCYIAASNDCRIHVDPFTINIANGSKLVLFRLVTIETGTGAQNVVYDFRTDQSNPAPSIGNTYSPSLVTQDYAVTCGKTYKLSLQGQDTLDPNIFNLGLTHEFTCPSRTP